MELTKAERDERFEAVIKDLRTKAKTKQGHARDCKKAPDDCKTCRAAIKFFSELPPTTLARVLAE